MKEQTYSVSVFTRGWWKPVGHFRPASRGKNRGEMVWRPYRFTLDQALTIVREALSGHARFEAFEGHVDVRIQESGCGDRWEDEQ